jgi:hypothetical protein
MTAFRYNVDSSFFKSWSLRVGKGHNRENHIYIKIFSTTSKPISIKLGANHPWIKGILDYSNKGPDPLQRGESHKSAKMGWGHLKIFFSKTIKPE